MGPTLEMRHITKHFGSVAANDDVSISLVPGKVLCIIGENGAGKSTLMNILYGMERPDAGEILLDGKAVFFHSSRDAMKRKIGMVFQHFMLVEELSCLDNMILGLEPRRGVRIDYCQAQKRAGALMQQYNMNIPLDMPAGKLWVGLQQKLEILKTLYRGAEIIILDEPTAVLTPQETEELFENIRRLAADGKSIIMITHKLDEVMRVADEIVVMRSGSVVKALHAGDTNVKELALHMVGHELPPIKKRKPIEAPKALEVKGVSLLRSNKTAALQDISFSINKGEIIGIAGISGNGQGELAQVIAGLLMPDEGTILLHGKDITAHDRREKIRDGISYIPEDRNATGVCGDWSLENNCFAGYHTTPQFLKTGGIINREEANKTIKAMISKFSIKTPDERVQINTLSGGNCQKVVVARETWFEPELIIAAEPSRGVDIGAINVIHSHMLDLRNRGTAILLISSSLDEIFALSDKIAVMFEGRIAALLEAKQTTREKVGLFMSGAKGGEA